MMVWLIVLVSNCDSLHSSYHLSVPEKRKPQMSEGQKFPNPELMKLEFIKLIVRLQNTNNLKKQYDQRVQQFQSTDQPMALQGRDSE